MEEVVSVLPSLPKMHRPHTTRSWQFVGLDLEDDQIKSHPLHMQDSEDLLTTANYGQDVIIGLLDTGN